MRVTGVVIKFLIPFQDLVSREKIDANGEEQKKSRPIMWSSRYDTWCNCTVLYCEAFETVRQNRRGGSDVMMTPRSHGFENRITETLTIQLHHMLLIMTQSFRCLHTLSSSSVSVNLFLDRFQTPKWWLMYSRRSSERDECEDFGAIRQVADVLLAELPRKTKEARMWLRLIARLQLLCIRHSK